LNPLPLPLRRRLIALALLLSALLALSVAWRWSPLSEWLAPAQLIPALRGWAQTIGPGAAVAGLALALILAVPLSLLILMSLLALGPWSGSAAIIAAALLAAAFSQWLGRLLGQPLLQRLAGPRLARLSQALERRGLLAVIALRLVPVAPFAIVNMVAGSTALRLRDMLLGTAIGMLPSTLAMAFFAEQLLHAVQQPGGARYALLAGTLLLILLGAWGLRRWMKRL